ncbi:MAG TPA: Fur family transcriptional regulator [Solirubrobacteraceae bacterium]|jgi:Fur family ferric uptake transcriptional regulator|nr:Fur family transcriptional regulator [Solirubrobacteraceae bacterium]
MSSGSHTDEWASRAEAALAAAGRRSGGARSALLRMLAETGIRAEGACPPASVEQRCALTATELEDALRARSARPVSRASVYRILDELERAGLVARVETGQGVVRYERAHDSEGAHHHHLVCDSCGVVMPFADEALERAIDELSERVPLTVSEHEIVLHGACSACAS